MIDPPRQEALRAIEAYHAAGVQVSLRHPRCTDSGELKPIIGAQSAASDDADLPEVVEETYVFARVTREQKLRLVNDNFASIEAAVNVFVSGEMLCLFNCRSLTLPS